MKLDLDSHTGDAIGRIKASRQIAMRLTARLLGQSIPVQYDKTTVAHIMPIRHHFEPLYLSFSLSVHEARS